MNIYSDMIVQFTDFSIIVLHNNEAMSYSKTLKLVLIVWNPVRDSHATTDWYALLDIYDALKTYHVI